MIYTVILSLHSLLRWLVLISLLFSVIRAWQGLIRQKHFTPYDHTLRNTTATIAQVQLIFGLWLYCISPLVEYFMETFSTAVHERQLRFFSMEHSSMMFLSVVLITIGSMKAKRKSTDRERFKTIAMWYSIALLIILVNIPWPFSPFAQRPLFRSF